MRFFDGIRRAVRPPAEHAADVEREVDEELAFHIGMREQKLRKLGYTPDAAAAEARRRFGNVDDIRVECVDADRAQLRSARLGERVADVGRDVRIAVRSLRRAPGFAIAAAALLALGIGGTTSVFSVVNAIYFRPLPYPNADRLALATASFPDPACDRRCARTPTIAEATEWRLHARSIEALGTMELKQGPVLVPSGSLVLEGSAVSREVPELLGLQAAFGRTLLSGDFVDGAPGVMVLSHSAWQSEFGGDSAVVGQLATIDERTYRIVGVLSPRSELGPPVFSFNVRTAQYVVPRTASSIAVHQVIVLVRRGTATLAAQSELATLLRNANGAEWVASVQPLRAALSARYRGSFNLLLAAAVVVLLITCMNVGGLVVARLNDRMPELATRAVLGAGRLQLVQQLVTETALIVLCGALAGMLLAYYGTHISRLIPAERLPFWTPVVMDARVVSLAIVLAVIGGALLSIAPLIALSPARLVAGLRHLVAAAPKRARMRGIVVATEVALSVTLSGLAGILVKQLVAAERRDVGSAKRSVVFVALMTKNEAPDASWSDRAIAGLRSLPGVTSVAVSGMQQRASAAPRARSDSVRRPGPIRRAAVYTEGRSEPVSDVLFPLARVVTNDYFVSIGKTIVEGRAFNASDNASAPAVAIINASAARRAFQGRSAIGHRIRIEAGGSTGDWLTIVGVSADDARTLGASSPRYDLYRPWAQLAAAPMNIAIHVDGDSRRVAPLLRAALRSIDASVPIASISPIETRVDRELWDVRFTTDLLAAFAVFAIVLACLGVYATVSYVAARRRREMAIRVAVGATKRDVVVSVVRPAMRLMLAGVLVGVVAALITSRLVRSLLYGSDSMDIPALASAVAAMLAAGCLAAYLPARRAATADPLTALRAD